MIDIPNPTFTETKPTELSKSKWVRFASNEFSLGVGDKTIGPAMREFIVCRDAIAAVLYCRKESRILLARQFRMPVMHARKSVDQAWIYEAVAGIVNDGEMPGSTAIREIEEETGVKADPKKFRRIGTFFASPGISSEQIHIYVGEVEACLPENPSGGLEEENEAIVSAWLSADDVWFMMDNGIIQDFKTYVALQAVRADFKQWPSQMVWPQNIE